MNLSDKNRFPDFSWWGRHVVVRPLSVVICRATLRPVVMLIALVAALTWLSIGPEPRFAYAIVTAVTVLIIPCPYAPGLATPMSVMVGIGKAAEAGILISHCDALQTATNRLCLFHFSQNQ